MREKEREWDKTGVKEGKEITEKIGGEGEKGREG